MCVKRNNLAELEFSQALQRHGAGAAAYAVGLLQGLVAFIWEGQSFFRFCVGFIFSVTNQMSIEQNGIGESNEPFHE